MTFSREDTLFIHQNYTCMKEGHRLYRRRDFHCDPKMEAPDDFSIPRVEIYMVRWMEVQVEIAIGLIAELMKGTCPPWVTYNYMMTAGLGSAFISKEEHTKVTGCMVTFAQGPIYDRIDNHIVAVCANLDEAVYDLMIALKLQ